VSVIQWILGNRILELPQSANSCGPIYENDCGYHRGAAGIEKSMIAAATMYRFVCLQYQAPVQHQRVARRVSPVTLFSRSGSELPPTHQYVSLDLEDYQ
jgi:hypothetical protein